MWKRMDALAVASLAIAMLALGLAIALAVIVSRFITQTRAELQPLLDLLDDPGALIQHFKQTMGGHLGADRKEAKRMEAAFATDVISQSPMGALLANMPSVQQEIRRNPAGAVHIYGAVQKLGLEDRVLAVVEKMGQKATAPPPAPAPPEVVKKVGGMSDVS